MERLKVGLLPDQAMQALLQGKLLMIARDVKVLACGAELCADFDRIFVRVYRLT